MLHVECTCHHAVGEAPYLSVGSFAVFVVLFVGIAEACEYGLYADDGTVFAHQGHHVLNA